MTPGIRDALLWTVVFVVIAVTIAAGVRVVAWITEGGDVDAQVWKAAVALIAAAAGGGTALTAIMHKRDG